MQLNIEQRKLVNTKPSGHSLIKGVAGSGKTTVAVNRIPFLLNNYSFEKDDAILLVTYNKTLSKFIEYLYEKVEEEKKSENLSFFSNQNKNIHIITIDSLIFRYFKEYLKENKKNMTLLTDNNKKYAYITKSIESVKKYYGEEKILDSRYNRFLLDEMEWIKACNFREIEEYQNCDRLGRMSKNEDGPQKLIKNSRRREAIFKVMECYDWLLKKDNLVDFMDMSYLALEQVKKKAIVKYTHIIIDESQDLTKLQLEFIRNLYK